MSLINCSEVVKNDYDDFLSFGKACDMEKHLRLIMDSIGVQEASTALNRLVNQ